MVGGKQNSPETEVVRNISTPPSSNPSPRDFLLMFFVRGLRVKMAHGNTGRDALAWFRSRVRERGG